MKQEQAIPEDKIIERVTYYLGRVEDIVLTLVAIVLIVGVYFAQGTAISSRRRISRDGSLAVHGSGVGARPAHVSPNG